MSYVPFIAVTPMRLASTRLPNKPLADIDGKSMMVHVAERMHQLSIACVMAATDATLVADTCMQHHVEAVLTRADRVFDTDRLVKVATVLGLPGDTIVMNTQSDEPLITPTLIDNVATYLRDHPDCATVTAVYPIHDPTDVLNPNVIKAVLDAANRALLFPRAPLSWACDIWTPAAMAQPVVECPLSAMPVLRHIGVYVYHTGFLRRFPQLATAPIEQTEQPRQSCAMRHGERIVVLTTDDVPTAGVDTPEDLVRMRAAWTEPSTQDGP